ncbi:hypothetical protein, partial [Vibrio harveyi]|uniref:hypothetical protein n=1 Tax=Vibrio harveyi TaxID=669 RepID=UPI001FD51E3F
MCIRDSTYAASEGQFDCQFGGVTLGEFSYQIPEQTRMGSQPAELTQAYDLKDVLGQHANNATKLLNKIDTCPTPVSYTHLRAHETT